MYYHNITKDDMLNGDGLRVVLWVAGCIHACPGCHNPITWDEKGGLLFDKQAKNELFNELKKDHISGITFSGGDPLHPANRSTIHLLAKEIKQKYQSKTIWLYTGYEWEQIKDLPVIKYLDILIDGKFIQKKMDINLKWIGSSNQKIINVQESLKQNKIITTLTY